MFTTLPVLLLSLVASAQDDPCAERCADLGFCVQLDGVCQATSDAHCQAARVCQAHGHCFFIDARPYAPGRCGDQEERDGLQAAREAESSAAAAGLLGLLAPPRDGFSAVLQQGWRNEPGLMVAEDSVVVAPAVTGRPFRRFDPADITCPMDTQRMTDRVAGEYTRTWCALPDGRKKGPELVVYAGQGLRMYTEYSLDQEHGEHVITEADGRVMVRGRYELGLEDGLWESWYVGGGRASRGEYHAGKKTGIWSEWSREGEESRCDFRDPAVPDVQCVAPQD
jgi:hypothetical protein